VVVLVLCVHGGVGRVSAAKKNNLYGDPFSKNGCQDTEIKFTFEEDEFPGIEANPSVCAPLCEDKSRHCELLDDNQQHSWLRVIPTCILSVSGAPEHIEYYCGVVCELPKNPHDTAGCMKGAVCMDMGFDNSGEKTNGNSEDGLCVYLPQGSQWPP
jgi:hypothetical protein